MIFVGWMTALLFFGTPNETRMHEFIDGAQASQTRLANSAQALNGSSGLYGSITAVFSIIFNALTLMLGIVVLTAFAPIDFTANILKIPFIISGILVSIIFLGIMIAGFKLIRAGNDE
jgi:hypothetical protein